MYSIHISNVIALYVCYLFIQRIQCTKVLIVLLPENVKDDQRLDAWKECSGTIGQKVFGDIDTKKIIRINNQKIRTVESQIARGKFKNPMKRIRQLNKLIQ